MTRKKLPIGIQTFREIRKDDCYYVDKTEFILRLIKEGKYYFLSRPRRFGKSLLLDTIGELFAGNETLFQGLYCHDRWDWTKRNPIIRISFGEGELQSREALDERIREILAEHEKSLQCTTQAKSIAGRFAELIEQTHAETGQRVVILIDEYDKPILDNLTKPEIAREMRDGLLNLYSVIKDSDAHVYFAFLTGVSKFSKASIFSGLNNLEDITVSPKYSAALRLHRKRSRSSVCAGTGRTGSNANARLVQRLQLDARGGLQPIRSITVIQHPRIQTVLVRNRHADILDRRIDRARLFCTGFRTPSRQRSAAVDLRRQQHRHRGSAVADRLSDLERQTTTGRANRICVEIPPNLEVKSALNDALLKGLVNDGMLAEQAQSRFYDLLSANDFTGLKIHFESLYASIPNDWYRNNPIAQYEGFYTSVFYSHIAALGLDIILEDVTHQGRIDMTVRFNNQIYLFEFKVVELVPEGKALQQLKDKHYAYKYRSANQPIHLIGVEFSKDSRSVIGFDLESIESISKIGKDSV